MPLSPDVLKLIHTIAETGNFSIAAEKLYKVPSAISYTIKKVEDELGVTLFDRSGRQVKLTEAGKYFVHHSQWFLHSYEHLITQTKTIENGVERTFTIVVNNIINYAALAKLTEKITALFPATELSIHTEVYNGCWEALYKKKANLIIGAPHTAPHIDNIVYHPIGKIEWDFVVAPHHPLAHLTTVLTSEQLRLYPAIVVKDTAFNMNKQVSWALEGQKVIYVSELSTAINFIIAGVGIGYIPHHRIKTLLDQGKVLKKAISEQKQPTQLFYAWNTSSQGNVLTWCLDYIMQPHIQTIWCQ